jgi:hypothetical protein
MLAVVLVNQGLTQLIYNVTWLLKVSLLTGVLRKIALLLALMNFLL